MSGIGIGVGIGFQRQWKSGAAPDPLQALIDAQFGNAENGFIYVPQPVVLGQQNLYETSAQSGIVSADGQPVGYMEDVSGNNNTALQSVSSERAIYDAQTGGKQSVFYDAADDNHVIPLITGDTQNFVFSIAVRPRSVTDPNPRYFSMATLGFNLQCGYINKGTIFTRYDDTAYNTNLQITRGQPYVIHHIVQDGIASIRVNGNDEGISTGTDPTANTKQVDIGYLGAGYEDANGDNSRYKFNGNIHAAMYRYGTITEAQLQAVDNLFSQYAGVIL